jgi:hypothetical protein
MSSLSPDTIGKLNDLMLKQAAYKPSAAVQQAIADKTLIMLVGATCMGKSTLMSSLAHANSYIRMASSITSRPPRPDDPSTYTYYEQSDKGLAPLFERIERGELVNYAINPYNHLVYGRAPTDYPGDVNIGDYFSSVVDQFRHLGFKQIIALTVVSEPADWLRRFENRFPPEHPQRISRLQEAAESLRWSLGQTHDHLWLVSKEDKQDEMVQNLYHVLEYGDDDNQQAPKLALACLELIESMLA